MNEFRADGGLASCAESDVNHAVECLLVGLDEPATRLLKKAEAWVTAAIEEEERPEPYYNTRRYFPNATEASWFSTLAIIHWLLNNEHDADSFKKYVHYDYIYYTSDPRSNDSWDVSLGMPRMIDAGEYAKVLEIITSTRGLKPPKRLAAIRSEGTMCYVIARSRLGQEYSEAEMRAALKKFLDRNMFDWLTFGHYTRAAEWMKIAYWNDGDSGLTPKDVVLKCYEHLKDIAPPPKVAAYLRWKR